MSRIFLSSRLAAVSACGGIFASVTRRDRRANVSSSASSSTAPTAPPDTCLSDTQVGHRLYKQEYCTMTIFSKMTLLSKAHRPPVGNTRARVTHKWVTDYAKRVLCNDNQLHYVQYGKLIAHDPYTATVHKGIDSTMSQYAKYTTHIVIGVKDYSQRIRKSNKSNERNRARQHLQTRAVQHSGDSHCSKELFAGGINCKKGPLNTGLHPIVSVRDFVHIRTSQSCKTEDDSV